MEKRLVICIKSKYMREEYNHAIKETGIVLHYGDNVFTYDETLKLVNYAAAWLPLYNTRVQKLLRGIQEMWYYLVTPNVDYTKEISLNSKDYMKFID